MILRLVRARRGEAGIIYCLSRKAAEATAEFLRRRGRPGGGLSRRADAGSSAPVAGRVQPRRPRRRVRDHRLRHGHRQVERALRDPPRHAALDRGVLPGDRPRRARRRARGLRAVLLLGRRDLARSADREFRRSGLARSRISSAAPCAACSISPTTASCLWRRLAGYFAEDIAACGESCGNCTRAISSRKHAARGRRRGRRRRAARGFASNPRREAQAGSGGRARDVVAVWTTRRRRTRTCSSACARFASGWRTNASARLCGVQRSDASGHGGAETRVRPMGCSKSTAWGRRSWTNMATRSWPRSPGRDEACALAWTARPLRIARRSTVQAWSIRDSAAPRGVDSAAVRMGSTAGAA